MKRPFQMRTDTLIAAIQKHLRYVERVAKTAEQMSDTELIDNMAWNDGGAAEPYRLEYCRRHPNPPPDYVQGTITEEELGWIKEEWRRRRPKKESESTNSPKP